MRHIITLDLDGVIFDGEFIPVLERTPDRYHRSELLHRDAPYWINRIAEKNDIYFLSSRSCVDATHLSRQRLGAVGVDLELIAGTICNVVPSRKAEIVRALFATYHFDDDPYIVSTMPDRAVLVSCPDTPGNTDALNKYRSVRSWREIAELCFTLPQQHVCFATQQAELALVA